jgi:hypothetical protein
MPGLLAGLVVSHTATNLALRGARISIKVSVLKRFNTEKQKIRLEPRTVHAVTSQAARPIVGHDSQKSRWPPGLNAPR